MNGSDFPEGRDWVKGSDGKCYPPAPGPPTSSMGSVESVPVGFRDKEVFQNIVDFQAFFKRLIPTLIMMFLVTWMIFALLFNAIGVPFAGFVGAFASGGFSAAMTQLKKKEFAKLWGRKTLTLSSYGADMQAGPLRLQMPWDQVERIGEASSMDALRAGDFHWVGAAVGAFSAATARRKEMFLLGVGRIALDPDAPVLVKSQVKQKFVGQDLERAHTGMPLAQFDKEWENGRIGQWIRAYRPDLMSDRDEGPPVNGGGEDAPVAANAPDAAEPRDTSGEARSRGSWWRRYTDFLSDPPESASRVGMNRKARSTVVVGAVLASVVLAVSLACSSLGDPRLAEDYMGVTKGMGTTIGPANEPGRRSLYSEGRLAGPHFQLSIDSAAVTSDLDADTAKRLGFDSSRKAATGHEILWVQNSHSGIPHRWDPKNADISIAVVVDGAERPLAALPGFFEILVVSVPENAPVFLRVTDEGRAFTMNLRDGSVPPESVYQVSESRPLEPSEYQGNGTVTALGRTWPVEVQIYFGQAPFREPFLPGPGWAAPRRTWLWFDYVAVVSDASRLGLEFNLDMAATFSLLLADGTTVRAEAGTVYSMLFSPFTLVFDVPDSVRSGTLRITPAGEMKPFNGGAVTTDWIQPPPAGEIAISFLH